MSYNQHQAPPVYPAPPPVAEGYPAAFAVPPPPGYPTKNGAAPYHQATPTEAKDRGDGFWKGCCAALCCCCLLDACF